MNLLNIGNYISKIFKCQDKIDFLSIYIDIIKYRRKNKLKSSKLGMCEKHHIIPKSLCKNKKWKNKTYNLIYLTCIEHFICHYLLWKIYPCRETTLALWNMSNIKKRYDGTTYIEKINLWKNSIEYNNLRLQSCLIGKNNPNYGNKWSDEQRKKLSDFRKGKSFYKTKTLEEKRQKMSGDNNIASRKNMSIEKLCEKRAKAQKTLDAMKTIVTCPFCGKEGTGYNGYPSVNMRRYHFDNCLKNPNVSKETIKKRMDEGKKIANARKNKPLSKKQLEQLKNAREKRLKNKLTQE